MMKADERHKLKTNELASWLERVPELGRQYGKWLIGGLVAVLLIVGVVLFWNYRSNAQRIDAWNAANKASQAADPAARADQFARVVKDYPNIKPVTAYSLYHQGSSIEEQARAGWISSPETLRRADGIYGQVVKDRPHHPVITPMALIAQATIALDSPAPDFDKAREMLRSVQTDQKADGALRKLAGWLGDQINDAEQVSFVSPPPTTAPDGLQMLPGRSGMPYEFTPPGLQVLPEPSGDNTGEPDRPTTRDE